MLGSRYYLYVIILNALVGSSSLITAALYRHRLSGSFSSLMIAGAAGLLMISLLHGQINKLPKQSLSGILMDAVPRWLAKLFLLAQSVLAWGTGLFFLIELAQSAKILMGSAPSSLLILILFLACILPAAKLDSISLLFMFEFVVVLMAPVLLLLAWRIATDDLILIDPMLEALASINSRPHMTSIAAGALMVTGFAPILAFHEHLRKVPSVMQLLGFTFGFAALLCVFLVPIGYFGIYGVEDIKLTWLAVGDSMRFENMFVGRMVYVFFLFHIGAMLAFVILSWHVSLQFVKQAIMPPGGRHPWIVLFLFCAAAIGVNGFANQLFRLFDLFVNIRFWGDVSLILFLAWAARNRKRDSSSPRSCSR